MKKTILYFLSFIFCIALAGCSTVASLGESTSDAGDGIVESTENKEGFVNQSVNMFGGILRWTGDLATEISGVDEEPEQTAKTVPVSQKTPADSQKAPAKSDGAGSYQPEYSGTLATSQPEPKTTNKSVTPAGKGFTRKPATASTVKPRIEVASYASGTSSDAAKITRGPAEVYDKPSPFGDVLTMLPNGATLKVITISGEWVEIKAGSNVGYLYKDLTNLVN